MHIPPKWKKKDPATDTEDILTMDEEVSHAVYQ